MYSLRWFDTFSSTIPSDVVSREVDALSRLLPRPEYECVLDVGCGIGRVAGPLAVRGYSVTGIDIHAAALRRAQEEAPGPTYVALDQQHVGRLPWRFDAVLVLWNSIGFTSREVDEITLDGISRVLRTDGLLVMDMYHPVWLEQNAERPSSSRDGLAVEAKRRVEDGRLRNWIEYGNGTSDRIEFQVYMPDELEDLVEGMGFAAESRMVWWSTELMPSADHARYQMLFRRTERLPRPPSGWRRAPSPGRQPGSRPSGSDSPTRSGA